MGFFRQTMFYGSSLHSFNNFLCSTSVDLENLKNKTHYLTLHVMVLQIQAVHGAKNGNQCTQCSIYLAVNDIWLSFKTCFKVLWQ